jgi:hypothetical protein
MTSGSNRLDRFWRWAREWTRVTHTFTWGLLLCVLPGARVEHRAFAGSPAHGLLLKALMIAAAWCFIAIFLELCGSANEFGTHRPWKPQDKWLVLLCGSFALSVFETAQIWAAPVAAFSVLGILCVRLTPLRRRWPIAPAGWLLAGVYPLTVAWPNELRYDLAFAIGGIATALEGAIEIVRFLRRPPDGGQNPAEGAVSVE